MTVKIDVFGSFGFGNLGDEIIPNCIGRAIRSTGASAAIRAFSRYDDVLLKNVTDHRDYLKSEISKPMLISGGGIIENREMSCLNRAMAKKDFDSSTAVPFAVSVEPGIRFGIRSKLSLRHKLKSFECIYVRDKLSANVLTALAPSANQRLIGDLGLWCSPDHDHNHIRNMPENYMVFIPSDNWKSNKFYEWIARELIWISQYFELPVFIVPISVMAGNDIDICNEILSTTRCIDNTAKIFLLDNVFLENSFSGEDLAYVLARSSFTISMRLHGCVISYAQKTPFLALAYHPKLLGFAHTIDWDFAILPEKLPKSQSKNTYGYRFEELNFESGDLLSKSIEILSKQKYDMLDHYKIIQSEVLSKIFKIS